MIALLSRDFKVNTNDSCLSVFCGAFNLKSLIKTPAYYKNLEKPSCIDLILTNNPRSFQNTYMFKTGLSDFHRMTVTVMKTSLIY